MVDPITGQRALYRALYLLLAAAILLIQILPGTMIAARWPGPDLLLALTMAWGLRRPDYVPPLLVGLVFLAADLVLQRPPGLGAALMVIAVEFLRTRNALWRDLPFPVEWAVISAVMSGVTLAFWLALKLVMVEQAAIGLYLIQLIGTVLAYPLAVAGSATLLGVRKVAHGELEAQGHRL